jgi:hypothetical protein
MTGQLYLQQLTPDTTADRKAITGQQKPERATYTTNMKQGKGEKQILIGPRARGRNLRAESRI